MNAHVAGEGGWTAGRTALLVDHYWAGLSAAASAGLIGAVSKNAVVSKRRRLGLVASVAIGRRSDGEVAPPPVPRRSAARTRLFREPPPLRVEPLPDMDGPPPPDASPRILADLPADGCAWPLGSADEPGSYRTLFCGAPLAAARSYCARHAARACRGGG
jgi:hypothetical protein